jgi:hypothetical protein
VHKINTCTIKQQASSYDLPTFTTARGCVTRCRKKKKKKKKSPSIGIPGNAKVCLRAQDSAGGTKERQGASSNNSLGRQGSSDRHHRSLPVNRKQDCFCVSPVFTAFGNRTQQNKPDKEGKAAGYAANNPAQHRWLPVALCSLTWIEKEAEEHKAADDRWGLRMNSRGRTAGTISE